MASDETTALSLKDLLLAQVAASFAGPNTSHPTILAAVGGLSAVQAAWKPAPARHSIWQIVEHLRLSRQFWAESLQGRLMHIEGGGWIEITGDEAAWQQMLATLSEAQENLTRVIRSLSGGDLLGRPMPGHPSRKVDATLLQILLWEFPSHDAYHSGQIRYLRALQGV